MYADPMTEFQGNHTELYSGMKKPETVTVMKDVVTNVVTDAVTMEDIKAEEKPDEAPVELKVK